ncbi:hypothetical protein BMS_0458 [Halobacteriovorax marinus SJ]|uniref:CAAX prenyl protease 2/Lysostaphin resistance protein A-like domain-containing protein n=2 Tax=Halobacteriovorax marinus TaxID=97084 RepID=E1X432_HALMS|nr:hypothetical protein BMS_0458 [Halobacteriovorax marinus SJ]
MGQSLNGNHWEGAAYFVSALGLMFAAKDPKLNTIGLNIAFYNMYDAWRDAGGKPSNKNSNIFHDYAQMFNPVNIIDPFAIGLLSAAAINRSNSRKTAFEEARKHNDHETIHRRLSTDGWKSILTFASVGMGEEALFRGFLFPAFSQAVGPWGGAITSSAIFAFAHKGANTEANIVRGALGMLFCWQYYRNKFNLNKNIFTHSWYDQILIGPFNIASQDPDEKFDWNKMPIGASFTFNF